MLTKFFRYLSFLPLLTLSLIGHADPSPDMYFELQRFSRDLGDQFLHLDMVNAGPYCSASASGLPKAVLDGCNQCKLTVKKFSGWNDKASIKNQSFIQDFRYVGDRATEAYNFMSAMQSQDAQIADSTNSPLSAMNNAGAVGNSAVLVWSSAKSKLQEAEANLASCSDAADKIISDCSKASVLVLAENQVRDAKYLKKGCKDHIKVSAP